MEDAMPTDEIIIRLLCIVDDRLGPVKKHPQAKLHPSEVVTLGLLLALKGLSYRAFYRWVRANYAQLFGALPEQSRLYRLLVNAQQYTDQFLADPTVLGIIDSIGIELIHPRREGRSPSAVGRKGISNHRWIVGIKLAWLINQRGEVVDWQWLPANVSDQDFRDVVDWQDDQIIGLADQGFRLRAGDDDGVPIKICQRGTWNERFLIETTFSLLTRVFRAKQLTHRTQRGIDMRLGFLAACFNCLLRITHGKLSFLDFVI
jgi:hypothetical protein